MAKIQDREATIKTMVVEIKALTVSGKQVTQALFKQLEAASLIDDGTLNLRGVPWGRVNYHVGCSEYSGDHLHVVWQEGDQLRRDCIEKKRIDYLITRWVGPAEPWYWTALLRAVLEEEPTWNGIPVTEMDPYKSNDVGLIEVGSIRLSEAECELARELRRYWLGGELGGWEDNARHTADYKEQRRRESCEITRETIIRRLKKSGAREDWEEREVSDSLGSYRQVIEERRDWKERWGKLWQGLSDLDQLFIAV